MKKVSLVMLLALTMFGSYSQALNPLEVIPACRMLLSLPQLFGGPWIDDPPSPIGRQLKANRIIAEQIYWHMTNYKQPTYQTRIAWYVRTADFVKYDTTIPGGALRDAFLEEILTAQNLNTLSMLQSPNPLLNINTLSLEEKTELIKSIAPAGLHAGDIYELLIKSGRSRLEVVTMSDAFEQTYGQMSYTQLIDQGSNRLVFTFIR